MIKASGHIGEPHRELFQSTGVSLWLGSAWSAGLFALGSVLGGDAESNTARDCRGCADTTRGSGVVRQNERGHQIKPDPVAQTSQDATQVGGWQRAVRQERARSLARHSPATSTREPPDRSRRSAAANALAAVPKARHRPRRLRMSSPPARGRVWHYHPSKINFTTHHYLVTQPEPGDAVRASHPLSTRVNLRGASPSSQRGVFASQSRWCPHSRASRSSCSTSGRI